MEQVESNYASKQDQNEVTTEYNLLCMSEK